MLECATEVFGCRRVGQGIRKGSEWWNDKVMIVVLQKKRFSSSGCRKGQTKLLLGTGKRGGK